MLHAHVVGQRPAASDSRQDDDLNSDTGQQADRAVVDRRIEHALGVAGQQRHTGLRSPLRRKDPDGPGSSVRDGFRRERQHRLQTPPEQTTRKRCKRPREPRSSVTRSESGSGTATASPGVGEAPDP